MWMWKCRLDQLRCFLSGKYICCDVILFKMPMCCSVKSPLYVLSVTRIRLNGSKRIPEMHLWITAGERMILPSREKRCFTLQVCIASTEWKLFPAGVRPPSVDRIWGSQWVLGLNQVCKGWLISIFVGSQAVIQRADGKLCIQERRGLKGKNVGRECLRETMKMTEGFIQIDVLFSAEPAAGLLLCLCVPTVLPLVLCVCEIIYERNSVCCIVYLLYVIYYNMGIYVGESDFNCLTLPSLTRVEETYLPSRSPASCQVSW